VENSQHVLFSGGSPIECLFALISKYDPISAPRGEPVAPKLPEQKFHYYVQDYVYTLVTLHRIIIAQLVVFIHFYDRGFFMLNF